MSDYLSPIPGPEPPEHCASCRCEMRAEDGVTMHHPTKGELEYCAECANTFCDQCGCSRQETMDAGKEFEWTGWFVRCKGGCPETETETEGGETDDCEPQDPAANHADVLTVAPSAY